MTEARFEDLDALEQARQDWIALAAAAIEPNPFYEPDFLASSARHLGLAPSDILVVRDSARDNRLSLIMPFARPQLRDGTMGGARMLYANPYTSLSVPLLRADGAEATLDAAFDVLARGAAPQVLLFPALNGKRGFADMLARVIERRGLASLDVARFDRAALETDRGEDDYVAGLGRTTRRAIGRKWRALSARGAVSHTIVRGDDPGCAGALAEFLALEASGWKGRAQTALASRPSTRAFAEAAFSGAAPRVLFERLSLDGRPIAMNLHLVAGDSAFTAKIAYDEAFAEFSPGALLDAQSICLLRDGHVSRIDSCASAGNRISALWREREPIVVKLVATSRAVPPAELERIARGMRLTEKLLAFARGIRARFLPRR